MTAASISWRPIELGDVTAWAELIQTMADVDRTEEVYEAEDLAEELEQPDFDPKLDSLSAWDGDRMVGFGQVRVPDNLSKDQVRVYQGGGVHPDYRGRGLGRTIMDWIEPRGLALAAEKHPGAEVVQQAGGNREGDPVRRLLEHRGYEITRYFHVMKRPLPGPPVPPPAVPVQAYRPELSEALRIAHNDAFSTHYGSTPRSPIEWAHAMESRSVLGDCGRVVVAEDGTIQAYTMAYRYVEGEFYIGIVGTIQSARGRGLARACLVSCLQAGVDAGYEIAALDVDSINPTGAGALYESAGFEITMTTAFYGRTVVAAN